MLKKFGNQLKRKRNWWGIVIRLVIAIIFILFIIFVTLLMNQKLNNLFAVLPAFIANILAAIGLWGIKNQQRTLEYQNFESSFFQLLGVHNDIVNGMELSDGSHKILKRDCFSLLVELPRFGIVFKPVIDAVSRKLSAPDRRWKNACDADYTPLQFKRRWPIMLTYAYGKVGD